MDILNQLLLNKEELSNNIKHLIYKQDERLFDLIDYENDEIFLEPLLFAFFNNSSAGNLEEILWGYIADDIRPKSLIATSNTEGVIYLPAFGYVHVPEASKEYQLLFDNTEKHVLLKTGSLITQLSVEQPVTISDTGIELLKYSHPLIYQMFTNESGDVVDALFLQEPQFQPNLNNAIQLLKHSNQANFNLIEESVKRLAIFRNGYTNSFATIKAQGIAFLNYQQNDTVIFFIDNIIHQCGHIIFNILTIDSKKLFTVPPFTKVNLLNPNYKDTQALYNRFHGLFTQTHVNLFLGQCIREKLLSDELMPELIGRFSLYMKRFKKALSLLNVPHIYTHEGKEWYDYFQSVYDILYTNNKELIDGYDTSNQPYVFDLAIFSQTNPVL